MEGLRRFTRREFHAPADQVQIFTPTPGTISTLMYCTERNPFSGRRIFVEKTASGRERQKQILVEKKIPFRYAEKNNQATATEEKPWARTKTSRKKPKRNHPKH